MTLVMDRLETESFLDNPLAIWLDPRRWDDVNPNKEMFWDRDRGPLLEEPRVRPTPNAAYIVEKQLEHHSLTDSGELSVKFYNNKYYVEHDNKYPKWVIDMLEHPNHEAVFAVDYDLLGLPHCDDAWSHITYADVQFYSPRNPREYQDRVRYLRRAKFPTWEFRQDEARPFGKIVKIKARHYA